MVSLLAAATGEALLEVAGLFVAVGVLLAQAFTKMLLPIVAEL
jgi:hypothetical protein